MLVAEINWRRLGDRRTAGLGLAAVRHHWLTQHLPSLSNLFLCAVPLALPALCLSLSFYPVFSLFSLPRSCTLYPTVFLPLALLDKLRLLTPYRAVQDDSSFLSCMKLSCLFWRFDLCLWLTYDGFFIVCKVKWRFLQLFRYFMSS